MCSVLWRTIMVQMLMWDLEKMSTLCSVRFRVSTLERFCHKGFLRNSFRGCPLQGGSTIFVNLILTFNLLHSLVGNLFLTHSEWPSTSEKVFEQHKYQSCGSFQTMIFLVTMSKYKGIYNPEHVGFEVQTEISKIFHV